MNSKGGQNSRTTKCLLDSQPLNVNTVHLEHT